MENKGTDRNNKNGNWRRSVWEMIFIPDGKTAAKSPRRDKPWLWSLPTSSRGGVVGAGVAVGQLVSGGREQRRWFGSGNRAWVSDQHGGRRRLESCQQARVVQTASGFDRLGKSRGASKKADVGTQKGRQEGNTQTHVTPWRSHYREVSLTSP